MSILHEHIIMSILHEHFTPCLVGRAVTAKAGSYTFTPWPNGMGSTTSGRHEMVPRTREAWTRANIIDDHTVPIRTGSLHVMHI